MLWQEPKTLAARLRDQGLVDCLVARYCLAKDGEFSELDPRVNLVIEGGEGT